MHRNLKSGKVWFKPVYKSINIVHQKFGLWIPKNKQNVDDEFKTEEAIQNMRKSEEDKNKRLYNQGLIHRSQETWN